MISKADGDNTPLGQRSLCVLPMVYRIWLPLGWPMSKTGSMPGFLIQHIWCWTTGAPLLMPGFPLPSIFRRFPATLDMETSMSSPRMLSNLLIRWIAAFLAARWAAFGYLPGFVGVYFSFHRDVRLHFKLAAGLGVVWTRDGGILQ